LPSLWPHLDVGLLDDGLETRDLPGHRVPEFIEMGLRRHNNHSHHAHRDPPGQTARRQSHYISFVRSINWNLLPRYEQISGFKASVSISKT
jgi:hypothetical protein